MHFAKTLLVFLGSVALAMAIPALGETEVCSKQGCSYDSDCTVKNYFCDLDNLLCCTFQDTATLMGELFWRDYLLQTPMKTEEC
ncbi:MAG: hypothetical protein J3Q66DRAFT_333683, partial [Benniella sp.]